MFVENGASGSGPVPLRPRAHFCSSKSIRASELGPVLARSRSGPPSHTQSPDLGACPSLGLRCWAVAQSTWWRGHGWHEMNRGALRWTSSSKPMALPPRPCLAVPGTLPRSDTLSLSKTPSRGRGDGVEGRLPPPGSGEWGGPVTRQGAPPSPAQPAGGGGGGLGPPYLSSGRTSRAQIRRGRRGRLGGFLEAAAVLPHRHLDLEKESTSGRHCRGKEPSPGMAMTGARVPSLEPRAAVPTQSGRPGFLHRWAWAAPG